VVFSPLEERLAILIAALALHLPNRNLAREIAEDHYDGVIAPLQRKRIKREDITEHFNHVLNADELSNPTLWTGPPLSVPRRWASIADATLLWFEGGYVPSSEPIPLATETVDTRRGSNEKDSCVVSDVD
jgi:hypothetical protein